MRKSCINLSRLFLTLFFLYVTGNAYAEELEILPVDTKYNPILGSQTVWNSQNSDFSAVFNRSYINPNRYAPGLFNPPGDSKKSRTKIPPLPKGKNPTASINKLASAYPAKSRPRLKRVFGQLYGAYDQYAAKTGVPQNDLSVAVAILLSGLYSAYRDVGVSCDEFLALYNQANTVIASTKPLQKMGLAKKRLLYEQSVMAGFFAGGLRVAIQKHPDAKNHYPNVQKMARKALKFLFKANPDNIVLTSKGLVFQ